MDLIRKLMLLLEAYPMEMGDAIVLEPNDPAFAEIEATEAEINHHLQLLRDIGYLDCPSGGQPMFGITFMGLTWSGHDFVDAVRSDDVWQKTKSGAQRAGGWTVDLLLDFAKAVIKSELGKYIPGGLG